MSINLNSYSNVYLIGIGGIGMSALARYFAHNKLFVAGRSEEHTSELQSLTAISYAVFCLDRKSVV